MTAYIPTFTSRWTVTTENADLLKPMYKRTLGTGYAICKYKAGAGFYGNIYDADKIFTTEEAAWKWINKEYGQLVDTDYVFGKEMR